MTRNTTGSIDLYFHMSNHYRKLRNVKSIVDTSPPAVFKSHSNRESRLTHRNESRLSTDHSSDSFYTTLTSFTKSKPKICASARSRSLSATSSSRRRKVDHVKVLSARGVTSKTRSVSSQVNSPKMSITICDQQSNESKMEDEHISSKKAFEHKYVRFSLRIIEDIIRNDLHTSKQLQDVFNSHIEANKGCLDTELMMQQINLLKTELKIPDKESGSLSACTTNSNKCIPSVSKKNTDSNCECEVVRNPPLCYKLTESSGNSDNEEILEKENSLVEQEEVLLSEWNYQDACVSHPICKDTEVNTQIDNSLTVMQLFTNFFDSDEECESQKKLTEHVVAEVHKEDKTAVESEEDKTVVKPSSEFQSQHFFSAQDGYVCTPGRLYIPKVYLNEDSIGQNDLNNISVATRTTAEKDHYLLITKNIAVNTDSEKLSNCEASTQIDTEYKVTSTETDFVSVHSKFTNANNHQSKMPPVDLSCYDLTPQRDIKDLVDKIDTKLLLSDKYDIGQNETSSISMYTNVSPALNQFYPANCTQTSLDHLVPLKKDNLCFVNQKQEKKAKYLPIKKIPQSKDYEHLGRVSPIDAKTRHDKCKLKPKEKSKIIPQYKARLANNSAVVEGKV